MFVPSNQQSETKLRIMITNRQQRGKNNARITFNTPHFRTVNFPAADQECLAAVTCPCGSNLVRSAVCILTIAYEPQSPGVHEDVMTISWDGGGRAVLPLRSIHRYSEELELGYFAGKGTGHIGQGLPTTFVKNYEWPVGATGAREFGGGTGAFVTSGFLLPSSGLAAQETVLLNGGLAPITTYGTNGVTSIGFADLQTYAMASEIQPDGRVVIAGIVYNPNSKYTAMAVRRENLDGSTDNSFGGGDGILGLTNEGRMIVPFDVEVAPTGKILIAGALHRKSGRHDGLLSRLNADGEVDQSFATKGRLFFVSSSGNSYATVVRSLPDGDIILGGRSWGNDARGYDIFLKRMNYRGHVYREATLKNLGQHDFLQWLEVLNDGKILVGGRTLNASGEFDLLLARYNPDLTLDPSFGVGGKLILNLGPGNDSSLGMTTVPGKIILGAWNELQGDGVLSYLSLDTSGNVMVPFADPSFPQQPVQVTDPAVDPIFLQMRAARFGNAFKLMMYLMRTNVFGDEKAIGVQLNL